jgi:hypothetical protein
MAPTPDSAPLQPAETPPLLRPHAHPGNIPRTTVILRGKPRTTTPEWKCLSAKLAAQLVENQQSSQTSRNRSHRRKSGRGSLPDSCTGCSLWKNIRQNQWNTSICTAIRARYVFLQFGNYVDQTANASEPVPELSPDSLAQSFLQSSIHDPADSVLLDTLSHSMPPAEELGLGPAEEEGVFTSILAGFVDALKARLAIEIENLAISVQHPGGKDSFVDWD